VVAREEEDRHGDGGHRLEGATNRPWSHTVRVEDVARDNDELGLLGNSHRADRREAIDAGLAVPRLRVIVEEAPAHPKLEIRRVNESNRIGPSSLCAQAGDAMLADPRSSGHQMPVRWRNPLAATISPATNTNNARDREVVRPRASIVRRCTLLAGDPWIRPASVRG
jgi:hypothetical protein